MDAALLIFLGLLAPFLTAWLNRVRWTAKTKHLVAFGVSIALAVFWLVVTGGFAAFNVPAIIAAMPAIYTISQAVYAFFVKNIASKFEAATDKSAVVISPADEVDKVVVTSNDTIKVSNETGAPANVETPTPIRVDTVAENEPRG
jgi:hypothetical protein